MRDLDLDHLQQAVAESLSQSQYGDAMVRIKSFVEEIINDPDTVAVVFASRELDILCEGIADAYYADRRDAPSDERRGTVIFATELVRAGGHVELIKDYLALGLFERPVRIALSDVFDRFDSETIAEWESLLGCEVFVANEADLRDKLDALSARFSEWNPSTVLTLGHNQDVVSIVAAHAPGIANRYYIHHGDHHLSLGVTCEAFQHVDLHNMAYDLCKNQIGVPHQRYWPLSAVRPADVKVEFLGRGALTTCSCGRPSKFDPGSYALSYSRAVACILKATSGYHVHIGELSADFLTQIYGELDRENVSRDRFIHIEWVASLSRALIEHSVDVYVSSFPLGGGKAIIEAMSVGVPVVTHESYRSRYHGGCELTYRESHTWTGYNELSAIFREWDEPSLKQHAEWARRHFERYYSTEAFLSAFDSAHDCADYVPPLRNYHGNPLRNYLEKRQRKMAEIQELKSEKDRIFHEWEKILEAYMQHCETIKHQQVLLSQLAEANRAAEKSTVEQTMGSGQAQSDSPAISLTKRIGRLIGVIRSR